MRNVCSRFLAFLDCVQCKQMEYDPSKHMVLRLKFFGAKYKWRNISFIVDVVQLKQCVKLRYQTIVKNAVIFVIFIMLFQWKTKYVFFPCQFVPCNSILSNIKHHAPFEMFVLHFVFCFLFFTKCFDVKFQLQQNVFLLLCAKASLNHL